MTRRADGPAARSKATAVLGFRVRTGKAIAVLLTGAADAPHVAWHDTLDFYDPHIPETIQPWHTALELPAREAQAVVTRAGKAVRALAAQRVAEVLERAGGLGLKPRAAGLVVGSLIDPAQVSNDHMRAHAEEGRLSRVALADALRDARVPSQVFLEEEVWGAAAKALGRGEASLKTAVTELGRQAGRPWTAHEKLAAAAGWMALAG